MIVDTSALLAYFDAAEPQHDAVAESIESASEPLVVSPYVVAELDYLVLTRHGSRAERLVLAELASGAWELAAMSRDRLAAATAVVEKYADVPIGIADASNIVLADAYQTRTIATLDRRHFGVLRLGDGSAPIIVP
ncbi:PIN domain-containing protein [Gordonia sp. HNM0687]|uniref:Ribonuclease VapC n=1 Tax=Gordonia mangrovi TaxID=2665643 RepID=A0A6L7GKS1_9ACTN|nr:PIN domain-containing protein [Gordonia mangrovi]MXP20142.1 PIN domain-containing protein [Gordonia mangrovi]UVF79249.1 PIN domain-containing protein [Gordonia mangrovi]